MLDDAGLVPGLILAFIGLIFVGMPVGLVASLVVTRNRRKTWTPCQATIEELETRTTHHDGDRRTYVYATYRYRAPDGSEQTGSGRMGNRRISLEESARQLPILVDPMNPARSMIDSPDRGVGCVLVILVPFFLIGLVLLRMAYAALS